MGDRRDSPPRQLPLAIRDFTGRAEQLAALDALLVNDASAVVISALDGTAGVGKTTLAVHWAHRVQERHFPDGTLYVNLRGYGPGEPATVTEVLDGFLRALNTPSERIPLGIEAQAALYRSLLTGRRILIVLDNANAAEQVRPLLPGSPGCLVLITSRNSLTGLVISEAATRLTLDLLSPQEAADLVRGVVGERRASNEPEAVVELTRVCARLPLALRIAAARISSRPYVSVSDVSAELADDPGRLDLLSASADSKTGIRAVFDWSYHKLSREQALLFRRLGLNPGPELGLHAAAALSEFSLVRTRALLEQLAEVNLIEPVTRDRYRFHDLLRAYAAGCANRDDTPDQCDRAIRRLLDWYAHAAAAAELLVFPPDFRVPLILERSPDYPFKFSGREQAISWVDTERENLISAVYEAVDRGLFALAMNLADNIGIFLYRRGRRDEVLEIRSLGLVSARNSGDRVCETWFLLALGEAFMTLGRWEDARDHFANSLRLAREIGDQFLEAYALNELGVDCLMRGFPGEALEYFQPALPLSRDESKGRLEAVLEGNLGTALATLGQYERALEYAARGYSLRQRVGDRSGEGGALKDMARAWQGLGNHSKAITLGKKAVEICRVHSFPPDFAVALEILGDSLSESGDFAGAKACWCEALEIFDKFGDHRAENLRERLAATDLSTS